jgi:hypothetical protein
MLFLCPPPFATIAERVATGEASWMLPWCAPRELDHARAINIADFGFGSDSPIVLDYRESTDEPSVRYLRWVDVTGARPGHPSFGSANEWALLAATFEEFVVRLEL